jgi:hypothetical protein
VEAAFERLAEVIERHVRDCGRVPHDVIGD